MKKVSLWKLLWVFIKIGCISFGGGYGMIVVMQRELTKADLIEERSFLDVLSLSQTAPGALAVNMAIAAGERIAGAAGAIIGFVGSVLPSFVVIFVLSGIFYRIKDADATRRFMAGTKPAVLALIAYSFWSLFRTFPKSATKLFLMGATIVATAVLHIHPILVMLAAAGCYPIGQALHNWRSSV